MTGLKYAGRESENRIAARRPHEVLDNVMSLEIWCCYLVVMRTSLVWLPPVKG